MMDNIAVAREFSSGRRIRGVPLACVDNRLSGLGVVPPDNAATPSSARLPVLGAPVSGLATDRGPLAHSRGRVAAPSKISPTGASNKGDPCRRHRRRTRPDVDQTPNLVLPTDGESVHAPAKAP
jgi:hypothetical protein